MPVPVTLSAVSEIEALLRKEMLPEELPPVVGAKVTINGMLWPTGMVTGKVIPLRENPVPFHAAEETVTAEILAVKDPL